MELQNIVIMVQFISFLLYGSFQYDVIFVIIQIIRFSETSTRSKQLSLGTCVNDTNNLSK